VINLRHPTLTDRPEFSVTAFKAVSTCEDADRFDSGYNGGVIGNCGTRKKKRKKGMESDPHKVYIHGWYMQC
jgi:hypothetical protein